MRLTRLHLIVMQDKIMDYLVGPAFLILFSAVAILPFGVEGVGSLLSRLNVRGSPYLYPPEILGAYLAGVGVGIIVHAMPPMRPGGDPNHRDR
jgi:hypothetical protein